MCTVRKYDIFEMEFSQDSPESVLRDCAVFTRGGDQARSGGKTSDGDAAVTVSAFRTEPGRCMVRFMPEETGIWNYEIRLDGETLTGSFDCVKAAEENHGKVVAEKDHFRYADGEKYIPFGTTCYAWIHQKKQLQEQTVETLKDSCFNKLRMLIFPKFMPYNQEDPKEVPFEREADGNWDVKRVNPAFWDNLDLRIAQLAEIGVEADLILFHPYDRWGFADMDRERSLEYLEYVVARYAAYHNIWWSLANEYEMLMEKTTEDWDVFGELLQSKDPCHHLISIHVILNPYPKREWMTHCSIQSGDIDRIPIWKQAYGLPVVIDECGYEGDIEYDWGNLSAFDMAERFWKTVTRGGFCTHGETFHREDEVLWWSKGGVLHGKSEARIRFLKELLYSLPGNGSAGPYFRMTDPNADRDARESARDAGGNGGSSSVTEHGGREDAEMRKNLHFLHLLEQTPEENKGGLYAGMPRMLTGDGWILRYFSRTCPCYLQQELPKGEHYRTERIDIWSMEREILAEDLSGHVRLDLPAKPGMAVLFIREKE